MEFPTLELPSRFDFRSFMKETSSKTMNACITTRQNSIEDYRCTLGPPDLLCISTETENGLFKGKKKEKCFTYCYGLPMASESVFHKFIFENFLEVKKNSNVPRTKPAKKSSFSFSSQKDQASFLQPKKSNEKIKKIEVFVFNVFSGRDTRYTLKVPGSNKLVAVDSFGNEFSISEIKWEEVFISSMLRLFCARVSPKHCIVFPEYKNHIEEFTITFLKCLKANHFSVNCLFSSGDEEENSIVHSMRNSKKYIYIIFLKHGRQILKSILKFFIDFSHEKEGLLFFLRLSKLHLPAVVFTSKILRWCKLEKENVTLLSDVICGSPGGCNYIRLLAKSLPKQEEYEKQVNALIEGSLSLDPNNFESWYTYCKILLSQDEVISSLNALNTLGELVSFSFHNQAQPDLLQTNSLYYSKLPKTYYRDRFRKPYMDLFLYEGTSGYFDYLRDDKVETIYQKIGKLPANSFHGNIRKMYKHLVRLENRVGFKSLLRFRDKVFVPLERADSWEEEMTEAKKAHLESKYLLFGNEKLAKETSKLKYLIDKDKKFGSDRMMTDPPTSLEQRLSVEIASVNQATSRTAEEEAIANQSKKMISRTLDELFYALSKDYRIFERLVNRKNKENKLGGRDHPLLELQLSELCMRLEKWDEFKLLVVSFERKSYSIYSGVQQCKVFSREGTKNKELLFRALTKLIINSKDEINSLQGIGLWLQKIFKRALRDIPFEEFFTHLATIDTGVNHFVSEFLYSAAARSGKQLIRQYFEDSASQF